MEWKEFGIEEVARLCGIQMKNDGIGAREIKALCPFCGDKHYHLYLNTQKNQWNCFRCGARGNDVSLYAIKSFHTVSFVTESLIPCRKLSAS